MRTAFGLMALVAAPAVAQEVDGPDIIVVAAGQPIRIDARLLRVAQRRFALDRGELAPTRRCATNYGVVIPASACRAFPCGSGMGGAACRSRSMPMGGS